MKEETLEAAAQVRSDEDVAAETRTTRRGRWKRGLGALLVAVVVVVPFSFITNSSSTWLIVLASWGLVLFFLSTGWLLTQLPCCRCCRKGESTPNCDVEYNGGTIKFYTDTTNGVAGMPVVHRDHDESKTAESDADTGDTLEQASLGSMVMVVAVGLLVHWIDDKDSWLVFVLGMVALLALCAPFVLTVHFFRLASQGAAADDSADPANGEETVEIETPGANTTQNPILRGSRVR